MGAKGAIVVPSYLHAWREGHAPVVAVLRSSAKRRRQTSASPPPKASVPASLGVLGLTMRFSATRRGGGGTMIVPHPKLSARAMPPLWQYFLG
jgi:hypothetical protein